MNRLISRIGVVFAGFAMAIGVGIAVKGSDNVRAQAVGAGNDVITVAGFGGYTSNSYSAAGTDRTAVANTTNTSGAIYKLQVFNGSSGAVRGNQGSATANFSARNSTTQAGYYISTVKLELMDGTNGTLDGSTEDRSVVYFGDAAFTMSNTAPTSGTKTDSNEGESGVTTLTWSNSDTTCNYFLLYNLKSGGTPSKGKLTITWVAKPAGPVKLKSPTNFSYNKDTQKVSWSAVNNASSYKFSSNNGSSYSDPSVNTYYDVSSLANGEYNSKIIAVGDGVYYSDSDAASFAFTKVTKPTYTGVTLSAGSLTGTYFGEAYIQCSAEVQGTDDPTQDVTWYVTETNAYGTTTIVEDKAAINSDGKVTFEANCTVYVWGLAADGTTHNASGFAITATGLVGESGSKYNPYTVAQAIDAIKSGTGITGVYATGVVCGYYNSGFSDEPYIDSNKRVSFYLSADGTAADDNTRIEAYYCYKAAGSVGYKNVSEVPEVGDTLVVYGNLTKYNSTYEFASNCYVYNHTANWAFDRLELTTSAEYDNTYYQGTTFSPDGLTVTYYEANAVTSGERHMDVTALAEFNADLSVVGNDKDLTATYKGKTSNSIKYNVVEMPDFDIAFGTADGSVQITEASTVANGWTISVTGDFGNTQKASYSQVGTASKPAETITFTKTLNSVVTLKELFIKLGGFSGTAGTITLKVDDTTVGTGSLNQTADIIASANSYGRGGKVSGKTTITITITDIAKGVKVYGIYYSAKSDAEMLNEFITDYMHMSHTTNDGSCKTEGWYTAAKEEYSRLHSEQKSLFNSDANYADAKARLIAWAAANGETFDPAAGTFNKNSRIVLPNYISSNITSTAIVIVISAIIGIVAIGGVIVLRRRKEK